MEQWTSTKLHHAINSTPSVDELSDLIEDIERMINRKRTEIQIAWFELREKLARQYEEQARYIREDGGDARAVQRIRHETIRELHKERINAARELKVSGREEAIRKTRAVEYVLQKGGFDCRRWLSDLVQFPNESSVLVCDVADTERRGVTFVPDRDADRR